MTRISEAQYQWQVRDLANQMSDMFSGHSHGQILHVIGLFLADYCLDEECFIGEWSHDQRVDKLMGALRELVTRLAQESGS